MSANNFFNEMQKAYDLRTKKFTTASGKTTYTAKTGRPADQFVVDAVIRVTTASTYSLTITVPDGVYYGQTLLVLFEVEGGTETVDVNTTTGDNATQMTAAGGYWYGMWHGATIGWATISGSAT
jgi:hypothetical protein